MRFLRTIFFATFASCSLLSVACRARSSDSSRRPPGASTPADSATAGSARSAIDPAVSQTVDVSGKNPLLLALEKYFRTLKPDLATTELVAVYHGLDASDSMSYAVVARGLGPHRGFESLASVGEIFGVFAVDAAFLHPTKVFGVFMTPRLRDYDVWILRAWADSVIVCGRGATYGDALQRFAYARDGATQLGPPREGTPPDPDVAQHCVPNLTPGPDP